MDAYCPCEGKKGVCGVPALGADGDGGPGGVAQGVASNQYARSREAIELARCSNPITINSTGQVLPK